MCDTNFKPRKTYKGMKNVTITEHKHANNNLLSLQLMPIKLLNLFTRPKKAHQILYFL